MAAQATILYIEDDPVNRQMLHRMIKSFGHHYIDASDAKKGLSLAISQRPALIIVDYMMPEMNGIEFVYALKQYPALQATPVVMLTSDNTSETHKLAMDAGCIAYLTKPVSKNSLLRTIVQVLATEAHV